MPIPCHMGIQRLSPEGGERRRNSGRAALRFALAAMIIVNVSGCGGGGDSSSAVPTAPAPSPTPTPTPSICGPASYESIRVVNDDEGPGAPTVSSRSYPRCDTELVAEFELLFSPRSLTHYPTLLYRELAVPNSHVLTCNGISQVLPDPMVTSLFTIDPLTPPFLSDGWRDLNGLRTPRGLDSHLSSGCSIRFTTQEQWSFPPSTPNLAEAQRACGGGFDSTGWRTFATKVNFVGRTGSIIQSCKSVDRNATQACQYFETSPRLSLASSISVPANGGSFRIEPKLLVTTSSTQVAATTHTCLLWTAVSQSGFVTITAQSPRKDVSAGNFLDLTVDQNAGPARTGTVVIGYGPGNQVVLSVDQAGAPAPTVTLSATPSSVRTNESVTLNWTSTNSANCVASGAWSGAKALAGSEVANVGPFEGTLTYYLNCTGAGGSASASETVTVTRASPQVCTVEAQQACVCGRGTGAGFRTRAECNSACGLLCSCVVPPDAVFDGDTCCSCVFR